MTMPTNQCPWRMQVHHITQETPDVWTISLICHDYYPYRAGQYALVSVRNSAETLRAYTISSTPGVSEYITLTVRRIDDGVGSQWLTRDVKRGDYLWLSDAMGEFTCDDKAEDKFLLLAAGCGVSLILRCEDIRPYRCLPCQHLPRAQAANFAAISRYARFCRYPRSVVCQGQGDNRSDGLCRAGQEIQEKSRAVSRQHCRCQQSDSCGNHRSPKFPRSLGHQSCARRNRNPTPYHRIPA